MSLSWRSGKDYDLIRSSREAGGPIRGAEMTLEAIPMPSETVCRKLALLNEKEDEEDERHERRIASLKRQRLSVQKRCGHVWSRRWLGQKYGNQCDICGVWQ